MLLGASAGGCTEGGGPAAPTAGADDPCTGTGDTVREVAGGRVQDFCGPAQATVAVGEITIEFTRGTCDVGTDYLTANFGSAAVDAGVGEGALDAPVRWLGILIGRYPASAGDALPVTADGTYHDAVVTLVLPHAEYLVDDKTVVLTDARTAGEVVGTAFEASRPGTPLEIRGTFTCGEL